jgi:hypothetical protein
MFVGLFLVWVITFYLEISIPTPRAPRPCPGARGRAPLLRPTLTYSRPIDSPASLSPPPPLQVVSSAEAQKHKTAGGGGGGGGAAGAAGALPSSNSATMSSFFFVRLARRRTFE